MIERVPNRIHDWRRKMTILLMLLEFFYVHIFNIFWYLGWHYRQISIFPIELVSENFIMHWVFLQYLHRLFCYYRHIIIIHSTKHGVMHSFMASLQTCKIFMRINVYSCIFIYIVFNLYSYVLSEFRLKFKDNWICGLNILGYATK